MRGSGNPASWVTARGAESGAEWDHLARIVAQALRAAGRAALILLRSMSLVCLCVCVRARVCLMVCAGVRLRVCLRVCVRVFVSWFVRVCPVLG
jgi:hypothetical protein